MRERSTIHQRPGTIFRPERSRQHHPDYAKLESQGWKSIEAEGKLPTRGWKREQKWALDMGLPGADSIKDRSIPTFARGEKPHFAGINTFLKAPYVEDIKDVGKYDAAVIGVPYDGGATYRPGARFGPQGMRRISGLYTPYNFETGVDLREQMTLCDAGDIYAIPSNIEKCFDQISRGVSHVFSSGALDEKGSLRGVADELGEPHRDRIDSASQVAIYEMVAVDGRGKTTTSLAEMVAHRKDTRLLPLGWRPDGPHAGETRPVGTDGDRDFVSGRDTVTYSLTLPGSAGAALTVVARLQYQAIPAAWAKALRTSTTGASRLFLRMYDAAPKAPETLALTVATVDPAK